MSKDVKQEVVVDELAEYKAKAQAKLEKDVKACNADITEVLRRYDCTIQYIEQYTNGQQTGAGFNVVKNVPQQA